jgi:hypothetical protein
MSDSRSGFAPADPGVPGAGVGARRPSPRPPTALPAGKASRIHRGPGQAGRHAGRAGRPAAENRSITATVALRLWSLSGTG